MIKLDIDKKNFEILKVLLKSVENELEVKVVYLVYNEREEISFQHIKKIQKFLSKLKYKSALIILEGIGGFSEPGKLLALEFRSKFTQSYFVAIPNFVASSLVFTIFISSALFMDDLSYISPVEPLIKNKKGYSLRLESTITLMKNKHKKVRNKAKICWINQANFVLEMLEKIPPSIVHEYNGLGIDKLHNIVKLFLLSPHNRKITKKELKKIGFLCWDVEGKEYWENIKKFTNSLKSELIKDKKISFIVGDSDSYNCY